VMERFLMTLTASLTLASARAGGTATQ